MPNPFALSAALEAMLDEAGGAFETNLTAVLRALRLRINQLIRQMDRERGRVTQTATNLAIAQQAEGQIRAALIAGGYEGMVADAFAYLPQLTRFSGLSPEALLFTEFDVMSLEAFRGVKLGELGEFTDRIVNQLQQVLMKGVFGAQDERELFKELEAILLDTPARAKTIYETALSEFVQTTIALKSDNTPDEEFVYTGPIDMRIRPFCLERVGQVFTREQIDSMDNGQLDNTFLTRGGYNCRHMWHRMETLGMFPRVAPGDYAAPRYQQQVEDVKQAMRDRRERTRPRVGAGT